MHRWMIAALLLVACEQSEEAQRYTATVGVEPAGITTPFETTQGYEVEVTRMQVMLTGVEFTSKGEAQDKERLGLLERWFLPAAMAHPGHDGSGVILGELTGRRVVTLSEASGLGEGSFLEGNYSGANLALGYGEASDGLDEAALLYGHSVAIEGTARRGGEVWSFVARVRFDEEIRIVDAPFGVDLREGPPSTFSPRIAASMTGSEGATIFDDVDFAAMAEGGVVEITSDAGEPYNRLRKRLEDHDHWGVSP